MEKGYLQIYTGDGKGKTTAALGLTLRALGAGFRVLFVQFMKQGAYSEIKALEKFADQVVLAQYGTGRFVYGKPGPDDLRAANQGLQRVKAALASGEFDLLVLDEANVALSLNILPLQELLDLLANRPAGMEVVLTGRGAPQQLLAAADLITEMHALRHYYANGVAARTGIEK
ncbi:MAG: cob(I)yrinic acid a,c-diamide adenosyltransferase [Desulfobacterales bacterium]